jgi:hypothetical protein
MQVGQRQNGLGFGTVSAKMPTDPKKAEAIKEYGSRAIQRALEAGKTIIYSDRANYKGKDSHVYAIEGLSKGSDKYLAKVFRKILGEAGKVKTGKKADKNLVLNPCIIPILREKPDPNASKELMSLWA